MYWAFSVYLLKLYVVLINIRSTKLLQFAICTVHRQIMILTGQWGYYWMENQVLHELLKEEKLKLLQTSLKFNGAFVTSAFGYIQLIERLIYVVYFIRNVIYTYKRL